MWCHRMVGEVLRTSEAVRDVTRKRCVADTQILFVHDVLSFSLQWSDSKAVV